MIQTGSGPHDDEHHRNLRHLPGQEAMMLEWLKSLAKAPKPMGPTRIVRSFTIFDQTISLDGVTSDGDAWKINTSGDSTTVALFEIPEPGLEQGAVTFKAAMKSEGLRQRAYLEMWCRFPGRGEFFSRGLHNYLKGTSNWASFETPFFLKKGERPDLIKLNLVVEGGGTVWMKDVELTFTPMDS